MANQVLYGFLDIPDLEKPVNEVGVRVIEYAIQASIDAYNEQMNSIIDMFALRTTQHKTTYKFGASARLQPMDNDGRARKVRGGSKYDIALPIFEAGIAWGANWKTLQKMTAKDVNNQLGILTIADAKWVGDLILGALFTNTNYVFEDEDYGNLTISGLANGDTNVYPRNGIIAPTTDNHYYAQAAGIADVSNPFPIIKAELTEHPENTGQVVHFISESLRASTEALTSFIPIVDNNVNPPTGTQTTFSNAPSLPMGELIGYVPDGGFVYVWSKLPAGYMVALTTTGEKPIAFREETQANLRGFITIGEINHVPFWERQYVRYAGAGGWNRTGAVVSRIGNASYAIPTGYAMPIR